MNGVEKAYMRGISIEVRRMPVGGGRVVTSAIVKVDAREFEEFHGACVLNPEDKDNPALGAKLAVERACRHVSKSEARLIMKHFIETFYHPYYEAHRGLFVRGQMGVMYV